ncbi:hypothetical protein JCM16775_1289 [Leptotrichia hofstadii]|uniref:Uncharacterized protein n=1 Tax=Leptotrichia hofstadii TaxID=157688 RepID=A0A510JH17_9FUSO|nr:hypothetical protein [Leptotrichia hofstadii]BBM38580.1 hypothetical protein JCM16775_1289 [Leptotrichia hofstadii]
MIRKWVIIMEKKSRKLSAMVVAGLMLCVTNVFSVPAIEMDYTCPIGKEKFRSIDYSPQCPTNKFVMFKNEFTKEELKKYEKIINSKEYKAVPKTSPKEYYLGRFYEMAGGFSDKEIGETYYKAYRAQINWNSENIDILKESLTKGISYLEKSLPMENKSEFPWKLAYLYISNKEFDKANALVEKQDKNVHLERIANFYYTLSDIEKSQINYYGYDYMDFNKESIDKKTEKEFREKALYYLQAVIKKNKGHYSEKELFRLVDLYKSLGNEKAIDEVFSKAPSEYWSLIVSYYLDEPIGSIGDVYDEKKLATEDNLKKALSYADKLVKMISKNSKDSIEKNQYNLSIILKAEAERRLGKFEEASKTLSKINITDIKDTIYRYDFERLKELTEKKDSSVREYTPLPIMY